VLLLGCDAASGNRTPSTTTSDRGTQTQSGASQTPTLLAEAIPVTVVPVQRDTITSYLQGTATLESDQTVQILAETAGATTRLLVEEGDAVEPGQVLAQLDDREARLGVERAKVQLAEAEQAYTSLVRLDKQEAELAMRSAELAAEEARDQHRRAASMASRGLISQQDLEAKRTRRDTTEVLAEQGRVRLLYKTIDDARFRFERAKTELQEAQLRLQYTTVKAPFAGVISQRRVTQGQYVQKNQHLFTIVDTQRLLARTYLPEKFSRGVAVGQEAYVKVEAHPQQRFEARVTLVSPVVESDSGTFKVTVELSAPPPELKPGMFASVFISAATRANTLVIPKRALTLDSAQPTVYRVQGRRARRVSLTVGLTDGDRLEVLSGLAEGDDVVVLGQDKLLDDIPVQVVSGGS
jgi:multidrug efflux pump subunit AcrA (membrane-fusion protein)